MSRNSISQSFDTDIIIFQYLPLISLQRLFCVSKETNGVIRGLSYYKYLVKVKKTAKYTTNYRQFNFFNSNNIEVVNLFMRDMDIHYDISDIVLMDTAESVYKIKDIFDTVIINNDTENINNNGMEDIQNNNNEITQNGDLKTCFIRRFKKLFLLDISKNLPEQPFKIRLNEEFSFAGEIKNFISGSNEITDSRSIYFCTILFLKAIVLNKVKCVQALSTIIRFDVDYYGVTSHIKQNDKYENNNAKVKDLIKTNYILYNRQFNAFRNAYSCIFIAVQYDSIDVFSHFMDIIEPEYKKPNKDYNLFCLELVVLSLKHGSTKVFVYLLNIVLNHTHLAARIKTILHDHLAYAAGSNFVDIINIISCIGNLTLDEVTGIVIPTFIAADNLEQIQLINESMTWTIVANGKVEQRSLKGFIIQDFWLHAQTAIVSESVLVLRYILSQTSIEEKDYIRLFSLCFYNSRNTSTKSLSVLLNTFVPCPEVQHEIIMKCVVHDGTPLLNLLLNKWNPPIDDRYICEALNRHYSYNALALYKRQHYSDIYLLIEYVVAVGNITVYKALNKDNYGTPQDDYTFIKNFVKLNTRNSNSTQVAKYFQIERGFDLTINDKELYALADMSQSKSLRNYLKAHGHTRYNEKKRHSTEESVICKRSRK